MNDGIYSDIHGNLKNEEGKKQIYFVVPWGGGGKVICFVARAISLRPYGRTYKGL